MSCIQQETNVIQPLAYSSKFSGPRFFQPSVLTLAMGLFHPPLLMSPEGKVLNAIEYLLTFSVLGAEAWIM
jgi:hypothetical protein